MDYTLISADDHIDLGYGHTILCGESDATTPDLGSVKKKVPRGAPFSEHVHKDKLDRAGSQLTMRMELTGHIQI